MRPLVIVVGAPSFKDSAGVCNRAEQGFVEQLVPQTTDEGLGEGVLRRFAWCDVVPGSLVIVSPS